MDDLRLSARLRRLQEAIVRDDYIEGPQLDRVIEMAEAMEASHDRNPKVRAKARDTSYYDGSIETLKRNEHDLCLCFEMFGLMDSVKMEDAYIRHAEAQGWNPQSRSGLRARRSDLEKLGIVVWVDSDGVSPYGRPAGRYAIRQ